MLDINLLRKDVAAVAARLKTRGYEFDVERFNALEAERKAVQTKTEELQARRNALSKQIGMLKAKGQDATSCAGRGGLDSGRSQEARDAARRRYSTRCSNGCSKFRTCCTNPCRSERRPRTTSRCASGARRAHSTFAVKDHVDIGTPLGLDFDTAAKLSGSRFTLLRGPLARLHRALAQFMLDVQTREHGYTEYYTPYIVNAREA